MTANVLVTGANGHVGYNLVANLVEHGYRVRAGVRDGGDPVKSAPLRKLGADIVDLDITKPETLAPAVEGMDGVFQVAAVFQMWAADPEREIVEPTVRGALQVLEAASKAGVKKVVYTSSMAAIGLRPSASPADPITEAEWNEHPVNPYVRAKTEAERAAWEYADANDLRMVAINPVMIIGPGFHRHTPSTEVFEMILREKLPVLPPVNAAFVDARDVAELHRLAFERDDARGRYIASSEFASIERLVELLREVEPSVKIPSRTVPLWLLRPVAWADGLSHRLLGTKRTLTDDMIEELMRGEQHCSARKAREELGWTPRSLRESLADTLAWIRERFLGA